MSESNIRVLVVDDSAVIRKIISDQIASAPGMTLAGAAHDGRQALAMLEAANPDVVTLDIQMPNMDGLATLDAILALRPLPVIMVSSLTQAGTTTTLDALERGAMDYVAKPRSAADVGEAIGDELLGKIRCAASADVRRILEIRAERKRRRAERPVCAPAPKMMLRRGPVETADACIAIGISTGGPPALRSLFETLKPPLPPIVVVQHMPAQFTKPFAWRLNSLSALPIKEAEEGDVLCPNQVLIAPGGRHMGLRKAATSVRIVLNDDPPVSGHRPSVDVLMTGAAAVFGNRCLGVIMTGMGRDGVDGCKAIRAAGGYVLGQDEETSDVYGMNKAAFVEGNVDRQFALDDAAGAITAQVSRLWCREATAAVR